MTLVNIKGYDAFKFQLEFDERSRIVKRKVSIGTQSTAETFIYNPEGSLLQADSSSNSGVSASFRYTYDDNGNILTSNWNNRKSIYGYDAGDRVISFDDAKTVTYDPRGFVIRRGSVKLTYNDLGQLSYVSDVDGVNGVNYRVWYNYDYRGRLSMWRDDRGNVTQFFYTNPLKPALLTHLHFPKDGNIARDP